jgi:hypothetical protein
MRAALGGFEFNNVADETQYRLLTRPGTYALRDWHLCPAGGHRAIGSSPVSFLTEKGNQVKQYLREIRDHQEVRMKTGALPWRQVEEADQNFMRTQESESHLGGFPPKGLAIRLR